MLAKPFGVIIFIYSGYYVAVLIHLKDIARSSSMPYEVVWFSIKFEREMNVVVAEIALLHHF